MIGEATNDVFKVTQTPLFFDLDGTLTDPQQGITGCIRFAMQQLQIVAPAQAQLTWCIGPPLRESFVELVGEDKADAAVEYYRQRFSAIGLFENELYPEIAQVLLELRSRGHPLFVASSKPRVFVERILQHFDLDQYFSAIYGSELDGRLQDKGELLAHALADQKLQGSDCVMIGDRNHDALGAANNGMDFIGVLYGFGAVEEFRANGFLRWVESPKQLLELIM